MVKTRMNDEERKAKRAAHMRDVRANATDDQRKVWSKGRMDRIQRQRDREAIRRRMQQLRENVMPKR